MKTMFKFRYLSFILLIITFLITGCNKNNAEDTSPDTTCRIQKYTMTEGSGTSLRNEESIYTYDSQGNLTKADTTLSIIGEANGNNSGSITTMTGFTYNTENYLIASSSQTTMQTTLSPGNTVTEKKSWHTAFTYDNEKLAGYIYKSTGYRGLHLTIIGSFTYDQSGNVVKQTATNTYEYNPDQVKEIPVYPSGWQRTWLYNNNQLVDYIEKTSTSETHPYTLINGLVTRVIYSDSYTTYAYDGQQHLTKYEVYINNSLNSSYTMEWADGKPALEALPLFKGFPKIKPAFGFTSIIKKFSFYANTGSSIEQLNESTYTNQINQRGFITSLKLANKMMATGSPTQVVNRTGIFTYTGCR